MASSTHALHHFGIGTLCQSTRIQHSGAPTTQAVHTAAMQVLVIQAAGGSTGCCMVWDLDTRLPFPCPLSTYVQCALQGQLRPEYQR
jgi:hypothetical protein